MNREPDGFPIPWPHKLKSSLFKIGRAVDAVSVSLPFVSISLKPARIEKDAAREIVIRLSDKRVLNSFECCDDCIKNAIDSIQDIRKILVDKQVDLKDYTDSVLYLLIEFMLSGIRAFLTLHERLQNEGQIFIPNRERYFQALELLRSHLYRCLSQIAVIANVEIPRIPEHMRYDLNWDARFYDRPTIEE